MNLSEENMSFSERAAMEYTDFCIAPEKQRIFPLAADAIYHVTADSRCHIRHWVLQGSLIFVAPPCSMYSAPCRAFPHWIPLLALSRTPIIICSLISSFPTASLTAHNGVKSTPAQSETETSTILSSACKSNISPLYRTSGSSSPGSPITQRTSSLFSHTMSIQNPPLARIPFTVPLLHAAGRCSNRRIRPKRLSTMAYPMEPATAVHRITSSCP